MNKEIRSLPASLQVRTDHKGNAVIIGRCAVYNSRSVLLGNPDKGFYEIIEPGFFSGVLNQDVLATIEHNNEMLIGRTKSGTLKIKDSSTALLTENTLLNTSYANNLKISIQRGDIKGMSFTFLLKKDGDKWRRDPTTGKMIRTLLSGGCEILYDITYTVDPAYIDTGLALRSMEAYINFESNRRKRQIDLSGL